MSVSDIREADDISRITGDVYTNKMNRLGEVRTERDAMITPSALMAMRSGRELLLPIGSRPAVFETVKYFERRDFANRAVRTEVTGMRRPVWEVDFLSL